MKINIRTLNLTQFSKKILLVASTFLFAGSIFAASPVFNNIYSDNGSYQGYLNHIRPIGLTLTGVAPAGFDWEQYQWEENFPKQKRLEIQYQEDPSRRNEFSRNSPRLPGVQGGGDITAEKQPKEMMKKPTDSVGQELLQQEDLLDLFGNNLDNLTGTSQPTTFEVPNSGSAPRPVLKSQANYKKE